MPCVFSWLLEHAFPAKNWKVCRLLFSSDYFRFYKDQEPTATEFLLVAQARKFAKKGCIIYFVMNTKGNELHEFWIRFHMVMCFILEHVSFLREERRQYNEILY